METGGYACVQELSGHEKAVASTRWSQDGLRLLSTSADARGMIWQEDGTGRWRCVQKLEGAHLEGLNDAVWSADDTWAATASDDKTAKLWDVETGKAVVSLEGHESYVFCVGTHPRSGLVLTGSFDETISLWDARTGKRARSVEAHSDPVTGATFDARGSVICTSSFDGLIRLWDVGSLNCVATVFAGKPSNPTPPGVSHCRYSPSGSAVLSAHHDSALRLWRMDRFPCRLLQTYVGLKATRYCGACTFHASGRDRRVVAAGSEDGRLLLWDLHTGALEHDIPNAHADAVLAIDAHPSRDLLATGAIKDNLVKLWSWTSEPPVPSVVGCCAPRPAFDAPTLSDDGAQPGRATHDHAPRLGKRPRHDADGEAAPFESAVLEENGCADASRVPVVGGGGSPTGLSVPPPTSMDVAPDHHSHLDLDLETPVPPSFAASGGDAASSAPAAVPPAPPSSS